MRCLLSFVLKLSMLSQYGSVLAAPPSNTTLSASGSLSLGAPLPPSEHPDIGVQLRSSERTRLKSGKVIHNCLYVMVAGWMTGQPYTIRFPLQLVDSLPAWSQAVRVTPIITRTTVFTTQLLAYAAGDIIDDLWWRYAEDATIFGVCPYRIVDKVGGRAIADWDFVQLPPPGDGGSSNSSPDIPIQYISSSSSSNFSSSGSNSTSIDDQNAVAIAKRQDTVGDSSSTNSTNTTTDDGQTPLALPAALPTPGPPGILVRFRFSDGQRLAPKSLLILPAQLLRTVIFRYGPQATVEDSGFGTSFSWTVSRLSYNTQHCLRLTIRDASVQWMDLGSAVLAVIPPPTDQDRWDAFVAEFTLPDRGVNFARLEAWQGRSSGGGGGGGDEGCDGGNEDEDGDGDGDGDGDVT